MDRAVCQNIPQDLRLLINPGTGNSSVIWSLHLLPIHPHHLLFLLLLLSLPFIPIYRTTRYHHFRLHHQIADWAPSFMQIAMIRPRLRHVSLDVAPRRNRRLLQQIGSIHDAALVALVRTHLLGFSGKMPESQSSSTTSLVSNTVPKLRVGDAENLFLE